MTMRDNAHLALAGAAAVGSIGSAIGANRAAKIREREFQKKYATQFSIPHGENVPSVMDKLRRLLGKPSIAKK